MVVGIVKPATQTRGPRAAAKRRCHDRGVVRWCLEVATAAAVAPAAGVAPPARTTTKVASSAEVGRCGAGVGRGREMRGRSGIVAAAIVHLVADPASEQPAEDSAAQAASKPAASLAITALAITTRAITARSALTEVALMAELRLRGMRT